MPLYASITIERVTKGAMTPLARIRAHNADEVTIDSATPMTPREARNVARMLYAAADLDNDKWDPVIVKPPSTPSAPEGGGV